MGNKVLLADLGYSLSAIDTGKNRSFWADRIISEQIDLRPLLPLLTADHKTALRFSWLLGELCEKKAELIAEVFAEIFSNRRSYTIPNFDRSLAKMAVHCGFPKQIEGELVSELFNWLNDSQISVSTKSYAMKALWDYCKSHPEITNELAGSVQNQLTRTSISFQQRGLKILAALKNNFQENN
jgi:hypothetical protein